MRHTVTTLAVLAASLAAQTDRAPVVVPSGAASVEGNAAARDPFGFDRRRHVQYVRRDLLRPLGASAELRAIAYRRDAAAGAATLRRVRPGEAVQRPVWFVRLGNVSVDVAAPPPSYPSLGDPAWQVAFGPRAIDFPDLPRPRGDGPAPFALVFPFDRPFVWTGLDLGVEHVVHHRRTVRYDYVVDAVETGGTPGSAVPLAAGAARLSGYAGPPGGTFGVVGRDAGAHVPLVLLLGVLGWSDDPRGAPALAVPLASDAAGVVRFAHALPRTACWNGMALEASLARTCAAAERRPQLLLRCGDLLAPAAAKLAVVSGFPDPEVAHGFVQPGRGLVFELRR